MMDWMNMYEGKQAELTKHKVEVLAYDQFVSSNHNEIRSLKA